MNRRTLLLGTGLFAAMGVSAKSLAMEPKHAVRPDVFLDAPTLLTLTALSRLCRCRIDCVAEPLDNSVD